MTIRRGRLKRLRGSIGKPHKRKNRRERGSRYPTLEEVFEGGSVDMLMSTFPLKRTLALMLDRPGPVPIAWKEAGGLTPAPSN